MAGYRPIPNDREIFHEYRSYAFRPEGGVPAYDPDEHEDPRSTRGVRRGIFTADDERPRTVCRHYWLEARVRDESHPVAGLASVATPPEHRREGNVRELLAGSLAEYRDRGDRLSILWPFQYRFYRKYGWDTANRIVTHAASPDVFSFARGADEGSFRPLEADEYPVLEPIYDAAAEGLALERDEAWWRHRIFAGHDSDPFVYVYERDGEPAGYLVYRVEREGGTRTMQVSELAAVDREALLALFAFCADHDSQVERVELRVSETVPVRELARDPDEIETTLENGPMVRIVDITEGLPALTANEADAALALEVEDPLADWNDGRFVLETADGTATCERATGEPDGEPDANLDVGALSQLAVGARSVRDLAYAGRLEADAETVAVLEDVYPETDVYLGHHF
ncbi:enhanced intracellular survival protein Eis [Natronococcus sp.]|uniref:GNAT family N-acetyltransferase n=1 Tax=Natronococcus sp. TaxID=35747 RepID=UPI0025DD3705|nr:GNAT family N-acetyltransferase [Natronococcus sp.]